MQSIYQSAERVIAGQDTAFIGSVNEDGYPTIKAMLPPRLREGLKFFYFSTNTSSTRAAHFIKNEKACVYFADRQLFRGVMLLGKMEVLQDMHHKQLLWQDGDTLYYPLGATDPDYCALRFTALSGRYYQDFKSVNFSIEGGA
jgi:general stress protein 26